MKKDRKNDRGMMSKEHWEKSEGELNATSNLKYAGEFSNPSDLEKSTKDLAAYVRKNKMKY